MIRPVTLILMLRTAALAAAAGWVSLPCFSQQPGEPAAAGSEDGIARSISSRNSLLVNPLTRAVMPEASIDRLDAVRARREALFNALGLEIALGYYSLADATAAGNGDDWFASSGEAVVDARWQIVPDDQTLPLSLAARARHRHAYGNLAPSDLRARTGALWGLVDGFNDAGFEVPELYLEQLLLRDRLQIRAGQMSIDDLLDDHRLRSAKRSFLNQAFSSSPAIGFPGSGLGAIARWNSPKGWDLTLAMSNIESTNLSDEADWSFDSEALFQGLQVGVNFAGYQGRDARVQVLGWNADALPEFDLSTGRGASITIEQELANSARGYLRCAWATGEAAPADLLIAGGLGWDFQKNHRVALGMAAGRSSAESNQWQGVLEILYRHQVGPSVQISPDIQIVTGDGLADGRDWLFVFGVRMGLAF